MRAYRRDEHQRAQEHIGGDPPADEELGPAVAHAQHHPPARVNAATTTLNSTILAAASGKAQMRRARLTSEPACRGIAEQARATNSNKAKRSFSGVSAGSARWQWCELGHVACQVCATRPTRHALLSSAAPTRRPTWPSDRYAATGNAHVYRKVSTCNKQRTLCNVQRAACNAQRRASAE